MIRLRLIGCLLTTLALPAPPAFAWPGDLAQRMARDARRLVPPLLAELLAANEAEIFADARVSGLPALSQVYADLPEGRLSVATREALAREFDERAGALAGKDFRTALIALGATYRLVVDLADPGVGRGLGNDATARAIRREFYLFVSANRDKIPLVVVDPDSLEIEREALPALLAEVAARTPAQAALLREEGQDRGRVFPHAEIDFRSPVFAVASTAYSRSVSAVAATWLAVWRSAGGDVRRLKAPRIINPRLFEQEP